MNKMSEKNMKADGIEAEMEQLLPNGKGVWVPIDHGASEYPQDGLVNLKETIQALINAGVNAIVAQKGVVSAFSSLCEGTATSMVAHLSVSTVHGGIDAARKVTVGSVKESIARGAKAVSCQINMGSAGEGDMIEAMGKITNKAFKHNVPVLGMVYARGEHLQAINNDLTNGQAHAVRLAFELGCHVAKSPWFSERKTFEEIIGAAPIPVLIAGGERGQSDKDILDMVELAMSWGAAGVCMGRQIFGHPYPEKMAAAIVAIVHKGLSADDALDLLS